MGALIAAWTVATFGSLELRRILLGAGIVVVVVGILCLSLASRIAADHPSGAAIAEATRDAMVLSYLDGGHGRGCNEVDDAFTLAPGVPSRTRSASPISNLVRWSLTMRYGCRT